MALKRVTHGPDGAPPLCDHGSHDPKRRVVEAVYLYTEADHGGALAVCAECLAHDRGEALEEWAAHEAKCGSPSPYCLSDALKDLSEDLGLPEAPPDLSEIVRSYERNA